MLQSSSQSFIAHPIGSNEAHFTELGFVPGTYYGYLPQPLKTQSQFSSTSSYHGEPSWVVDSGATNHITSNLSNLSLQSPYNGNDKVAVGNGKKLPISNICLGCILKLLLNLSFLYLMCFMFLT